MIKVTFLVQGKIKSAPLREVAQYYKKLLQRGEVVVNVIEYDLRYRHKDGEGMRQEETVYVQQLLQKYGKVWYCSEFGTSYTSERFAQFVYDEARDTGKITFLMSGPFGLDEVLLKPYVLGKISLSSMTFPHELAQVVFLEQLYRTGTILAGKSYHHE